MATIDATPNATSATGSTTSRRRNEKRRCRIAFGTVRADCRKRTPALAAATAATVSLSKKAPISGAGRRRPRQADAGADRRDRRRRGGLVEAVLAVDQGREHARSGEHEPEPDEDRTGRVLAELLRGDQAGEDDVGDQRDHATEQEPAAREADAPDDRPGQAASAPSLVAHRRRRSRKRARQSRSRSRRIAGDALTRNRNAPSLP